jgi:hypothetical protein
MRKNPDKNTVARANKQNKTTYTINKNDISHDNLSTAFNNMKSHNEVHFMRKSYQKIR